eukprot:scaffold61041_cov54-Phaeocystis_antarctica.AAC.2
MPSMLVTLDVSKFSFLLNFTAFCRVAREVIQGGVRCGLRRQGGGRLRCVSGMQARATRLKHVVHVLEEPAHVGDARDVPLEEFGVVVLVVVVLHERRPQGVLVGGNWSCQATAVGSCHGGVGGQERREGQVVRRVVRWEPRAADLGEHHREVDEHRISGSSHRPVECFVTSDEVNGCVLLLGRAGLLLRGRAELLLLGRAELLLRGRAELLLLGRAGRLLLGRAGRLLLGRAELLLLGRAELLLLGWAELLLEGVDHGIRLDGAYVSVTAHVRVGRQLRLHAVAEAVAVAGQRVQHEVVHCPLLANSEHSLDGNQAVGIGGTGKQAASRRRSRARPAHLVCVVVVRDAGCDFIWEAG